ncbi:hypothetical protein SLEP1_g42543 [Rubroshorea leprosula]|uniref:Uncharacterized protein n=1 Tax=Rubroshorea leprosula TaxID=152421 RepID=A0AAV5LA90_9ROSI|nr:hypothetical protein SLEP1_g42543 [Rubroshorea leprosula]
MLHSLSNCPFKSNKDALCVCGLKVAKAMAPITTIFFFFINSLYFLCSPTPRSPASNPFPLAFSPLGYDAFHPEISAWL